MTGKNDQVGVNSIPTQEEDDLAVAEISEQNKVIVTIWQINGSTYEDIILLIDRKTIKVMLCLS